MRHNEGNSELLARIDERTKNIHETVVKFEQWQKSTNKKILLIFILIILLNADHAPMLLHFVSTAFAKS